VASSAASGDSFFTTFFAAVRSSSFDIFSMTSAVNVVIRTSLGLESLANECLLLSVGHATDRSSLAKLTMIESK
jgi:hypothetical protein